MLLVEIEREMRRSGFAGKVKVRGFYLDALDNRHLSKEGAIDLAHS